MSGKPTEVFGKPFTQQEPVSEEAIERAVAVLRHGRLHRYNTLEGEDSEASLLERDFADFLGVRYCLACASGGYAMHVALSSLGLRPGEPVLTNAWTLSPVPGAIHNAGGLPLLVETGPDLTIDIQDLAAKAAASGARFLLLSHMRGHIGDMDAILKVCSARDITLIEDCAHTMGAHWNGRKSGTFGTVACFSTQTYKHLNSGEGGLLTTDDPDVMARAVLLSGSYMLYGRHLAVPDAAAFDEVRLETPNYSGRMDNLRAAILRPQLRHLEERCRAWNRLYDVLDAELRTLPGVRVCDRPAAEGFVGSSIQFFLDSLREADMSAFIDICAARGVDVKWFGAAEPKGFTSRFDSWRYFARQEDLPQTRRVLAQLCDMRIPLTFDAADCRQIAKVIGAALYETTPQMV